MAFRMPLIGSVRSANGALIVGFDDGGGLAALTTAMGDGGGAERNRSSSFPLVDDDH